MSERFRLIRFVLRPERRTDTGCVMASIPAIEAAVDRWCLDSMKALVGLSPESAIRGHDTQFRDPTKAVKPWVNVHEQLFDG